MIARLTLSYRGAAYAGWQRQENALAVQQVVEEALGDLLGLPAPQRIHGASRTDAGVHARGQVAHLVLLRPFPPAGLVHGTNARLPEDVRVLAADEAPEGFHARKHAAAKEYRYRLSRAAVVSPLDAPYVAPVEPRVDLERMAAAARHLPGRHDFSAFAAAGGAHRDPHRQIFAADWTETGEELRFTDHRRRLPPRHGPRPRRHSRRSRPSPPHPRGFRHPPNRRPPRSRRPHSTGPRPHPGESHLPPRMEFFEVREQRFAAGAVWGAAGGHL